MIQKFYFALFTFLLFSASGSANEVDSLLIILEQTMEQRAEFDAVKLQKINQLKSLLNDATTANENTYHITKQLIKTYEKYNFDSTLCYTLKNLQLAKALNQPNFMVETNLILCGLLSSSGRYKEASDILSKLEKGKLSQEILIQYYKQYREVFSNLSMHTSLLENTEYYSNLSNVYTDSLLRILPANTDAYLEIIEEQNRQEGHLLTSKKINTHRLAMAEPGTRTHAKITYDRAQTYSVERDTENQKKYLILSAISDIKASVKDNASLADLALLLNTEGRVDKAYKYINFAMEDVLLFNSSMRFLSLSSILPIITDDYQRKSDEQKANLKKYLKIISLLSIFLMFAITYIYRQIRIISLARNDLRIANTQLKDLNNTLNSANFQLNNINSELSEANHVKEQYIGNFLTICSNYIDKLDGYRKMVNKQISLRKVDELFSLTKSQQIVENEVKEFYNNFDHTFLSIYPNFIEGLNTLLIENERIVLKNGELLNTELRIFALIRLGINDSSKIAKLLRYSVNTIYNYRVKIKNKAAGNRDEFEQKIMQIDACKN